MAVSKAISKPRLSISVSNGESSSELSDSNEELSDTNEVNDSNHESDSDESNNEDSPLVKNEGWADSVAKILGATKPKNKKTLVLSRAKKFSEIKVEKAPEKPAFEVVGDKEVKTEDVKVEPKVEEPPTKKKRIEKASIRVKPNILEKDREKVLSKIATKGVVQLFNAVRNQQKSLDRQLDNEGLTETKKEKILKKFDKRAFLDSLMGSTKSVIVDQDADKLKDEVKDEAPKWSALRDDFMTGAKLKDWDKESVDE